MKIDICYGILGCEEKFQEFCEYHYPDEIDSLFAQLSELLKRTVKNGVTSFMLGSDGEFNKRVFDVCKQLQSNGCEFMIKVVIIDEKLLRIPKNRRKVLDLYKDEELYFLNSVAYDRSGLLIPHYEECVNQFIVDHSLRCVNMIEKDETKVVKCSTRTVFSIMDMDSKSIFNDDSDFSDVILFNDADFSNTTEVDNTIE